MYFKDDNLPCMSAICTKLLFMQQNSVVLGKGYIIIFFHRAAQLTATYSFSIPIISILSLPNMKTFNLLFQNSIWEVVSPCTGRGRQCGCDIHLERK